MAKGVFYRSDTRPPRDDLIDEWDRHKDGWEMFKVGFDPRDANVKITKRFKPEAPNKTFDLEPNSAVCVTRHFEAASLFPVEPNNCRSYVYIVELEASKLYNTQEKQWDYAYHHQYDPSYPFKGFKYKSEEAVNDTHLWPMFGQERATQRIAPGEIAGCIHVDRNAGTGRDKFCDRFQCMKWIPNPDFTGSEGVTKLIGELVVPLVQKKDWIKTPKQVQGFAKSIGR